MKRITGKTRGKQAGEGTAKMKRITGRNCGKKAWKNRAKIKRIAAKAGQKGILFSLDFSISFVLMLSMVLVFSILIFSFRMERESELRQFSLAKNRALFLDSLVKRPFDGNQPGLALFDGSKRRVLENRIAEAYVAQEGKFGLSEIKAECPGSEKMLYERQAEGTECDVMPRIVFIGQEECLLLAKFCGD
ncbi:MAG: hypothetical protein NT067_05850 [Candidatus Diapherotrites archaeon]|nr:hypothetical protein [Candidatus Diapherotrites archaeon]